VTEPTNAEIARRLDEAVKAVERLTSTLETSYVRKEVYEAKHEALRNSMLMQIKDVSDDVVELKGQRQKDADRWKQFAFALGLAILMLLIQGAITVSNFMSRTTGGN